MYTIGGILYHHGILGQKWGKRNGPPYPLSEGAHSSSEKKAGYKKSIGGGRNESLYNRSKQSNKQGGFSLDDYDEEEQELMKELMDDEGFREAFEVSDEDYENFKKTKNTQGSFKNESVDPETGFKLKKKDTPPQKDLKVVNPTYKDGGVEARNNCVYCSATFEMRRRGYDVTTNFSKEPMNGFKLYNSIFPGNKQEIIKTSSSNILTSNSVPSNFGFDYRNKGKEIEEASRKALFGENTKHAKEVIAYMKKQKDQRGAIGLGWGVDGGHMACYEVKNGKFTVYDAQIGKEFKGKDLEDLLSATIFCSYARLDNVEVNKKKIKEACK